ncbi:hypothetical protein GCM10022226_05730 [Sphaerisporangium flaviroseum]|uniref:Lasso RiPP family leader peptide-containing protein n=1 Tax=Sphaerisporangium flaviroseum TaxID=509199 RepID=A0ABP7HDH8_9ACTN
MANKSRSNELRKRHLTGHGPAANAGRSSYVDPQVLKTVHGSTNGRCDGSSGDTRTPTVLAMGWY